MRKHFKSILLLLIMGIMPLLTACNSTQILGEYVESYCEKPTTERIAIRATSSPVFAPNAVEVTCAGDYTPTNKQGVTHEL